MGYTTYFSGEISISPPLNAEEIAFLKKHNETRRMKREKGPYYVDNAGMCGQDREDDIIDYNEPPSPELSLWCGWVCDDEGKTIGWDGGEKFYSAAEWMKWLIDHILGDEPLAKAELPFLQGHILNGEIEAAGEDSDDRWKLIVRDNVVSVARGLVGYGEPELV